MTTIYDYCPFAAAGSGKVFSEAVEGLHRENQAKNSSRSKMANRWTRDRFGMLKGFYIQQRTGNVPASRLFQNAPFPEFLTGQAARAGPVGVLVCVSYRLLNGCAQNNFAGRA
jgi:hypothetical protein